MVADLGLKPTIGVRPVLLARCFEFEGLGFILLILKRLHAVSIQ